MSRFVPAGAASEDTSAPADDAWTVARREVSSSLAPKKDQAKQEPSKSLYETLQANKAAKQAEFEESIRLKNQFRSLDEDEVDFLDSVVEIERAKEAAVKKETENQLETYRRQREATQKADLDLPVQSEALTSGSNDTNTWVTKKRRKKELDSGTSKLRKLSTVAETTRGTSPSTNATVVSHGEKSIDGTENQQLTLREESGSSSPSSRDIAQPSTPTKVSALGLEAYSSDED